MNVTFYNFSKRRNSTAQPAAGTSYNCVLKEGTSTSRPEIMIKWQGGGAPSAYNYAYISAFGRYYWVNNWTYDERCWTASCAVDVLATYKSAIGSASKYVLRSASDVDTDIIDTLYPAKMTYKTASATVTSPYGSSMSSGFYILSISSGGTTGVQYIMMNETQLKQLMQYCYQETATIWSTSMSTTDIGDALQAYGDNMAKSVYNPFQYINSIMWFPVSFGIDPALQTNLRLGPMPTGITYYLPAGPTMRLSYSITIPTITSTYKWEKAAPYRQYLLYAPPFGEISLDPTLLVGASTISVEAIFDYVSGGAVLRVGSGGVSIACVSGQIGIPVAAASNSIDNLGALTSKMSAATSVVGGLASILTGNIGGAVSAANSAVSSALSAYAALAPRVQQTGTAGGIGYLSENHYLRVIQFDRPDTDNAEFGQPLYKVKTISSLSGYVKLADGEVACAATEAEHRELEAFLTGGFFYE